MRKPLLSLAAIAIVATACSSSGMSHAPSNGSNPEHHRETAPPARPAATPYPAVTYEDPGVNPFVDPDEDRVSTFALDVDTASYTIAQRYIEDGNRPDPASVRVEEWVNAFEQGYDAPEDDAFAISVDGGPTPFTDPDEVLLRIGLQARAVRDRARQDASLTFVIDTSGSMEREGRLELVKDSLRILVDELDRDDRVAIVTFGDDARVLLESTSARDRDRILSAIDDLRPGGSTNLEAGLAARLRPGAPSAHGGRHRPRRPRVGRGGERRPDRCRRDPRSDPRRRGGGHRARERRRRDGQLQRRPARAARRPGRRVLRVRQPPRRGADPVPRPPHLHPPVRRARREGPGRVRPGSRGRLPPGRVREPGRGRRGLHRSRRGRRGDRRGTRGDGALRASVSATIPATGTGWPRSGSGWTDPDDGRTREAARDVRAGDLSRSFERTDPHFRFDAIVAATAEVLRDSEFAQRIDLDDILRVADEDAGALPATDEVHGFLELLDAASRLDG